jgi:Asp-tRNA(Asn)/Glu-tRNA(Gln) amidotransferase A subunit family amidase
VYIQIEKFDSLLKKSKELDENDQSIDAWYTRTVTKTHRDWQLLNSERLMVRQKWADYFKEYDVLLCPAFRIAAFPHDHTMTLESPQRITTKSSDQDVPRGRNTAVGFFGELLIFTCHYCSDRAYSRWVTCWRTDYWTLF